MRDERRWILALVLSAEATEQRRADRAAATAARHEASTSLMSALSDHHASMSRIHRRSEARHRATAEIFRNYAIRLVEAEHRSGTDIAGSLMAAVATVVGARRAAVSFANDVRDLGVLASDEVARAAQEWEFVLGEGPAHDNAVGGPLLVGAGALPRRWPQYASAVSQLGIESVGAVALRRREARLGSLVVFDVFEPHDVRLTRLGQVADALLRVLVADANQGAAHDIAMTITDHVDHRGVVHRAAGMLSEQLACSVSDALAVLRARAFVENVDPMELATRVLAGDVSMYD